MSTTSSMPITVKDTSTGEEWHGKDLAAIIKRAYGQGATLEIGQRSGWMSTHTVTGAYSRKAGGRPVLGTVAVYRNDER